MRCVDALYVHVNSSNESVHFHIKVGVIEDGLLFPIGLPSLESSRATFNIRHKSQTLAVRGTVH